MLKALDERGTAVLASDAERGEAHTCPACCVPVTLKRGAIVVPHFAHQPGATCAFGGEESPRHMAMKAHMGALFRATAACYEVPLLGNARRADLLLSNKVVIECQASSLGIDEWDQRTSDYNRLGYRLLWVWDARVAGLPPSVGAAEHGEDFRISATFRHCYKQAYGHAYVLFGDELRAVRLHKVTRVDDGAEYFGGSGTRTPKTLRNISTKVVLPRAGSVPPLVAHIGVSGERLVTFGEGVWWKTT